jgi:site-specific DNA-methyltransferase (adenine-specific)
VWDKTEGARPQLGRYRNQCEYVVWGSHGPLPLSGPVAPGVFRHAATVEPKHHITGKPSRLMVDLLRLVSPGAVVLDPFMGSGSTGVACVRSGIGFIGIEIDPAHYETSLERIRAAHLQPPLRVDAGAQARLDLGASLFPGDSSP